MYKLFVLPTPQTSEYLRTIFASVPQKFDFDALGVEIASSVKPITAKEGTIYRATPGPMNIWYETATGESSWLLPLYPSPEMVKRHKQIGEAWGRKFLPFMRLGAVDSQRKHTKQRFNSLATGMIDTSPIFTFHNEVVLVDDAIMPAHADFYDDYQNRGDVSNPVLYDDITDVD